MNLVNRASDYICPYTFVGGLDFPLLILFNMQTLHFHTGNMPKHPVTEAGGSELETGSLWTVGLLGPQLPP